MNQQLKKIVDTIYLPGNLSAKEREDIINIVTDISNQLKSKNRELEIESSLERVRAVAMSMMKADDLLKICEVQFNELKQLGFSEIRNALVGIYHDEKDYFTDYDYSDFAGGNIHKIPYNKNSVVDKGLMRMKSAHDAFTEFIVEGKELQEWKAFRKQNGEYDDERINQVSVLYYYFYSISQGNIGISTFKKISEEQLNILKRFRNVFDLAYKRYVDISNSETQAREARIETALERVRAVAMAMRGPADMLEVCKVICAEMDSMNVKEIRNVQTAIFKKEKGTYLDYEYYRLHDKTFITEVDYTKDKISIAFAEGMMNGTTELFTRFLAGKEVKDWYEFQKTTNVFIDSYLETATSLNYYWFSLGPVALGISTYNPLNEDAINLFKRFRNVFDLSYRRFLDIENALAQAREAQIQLALERVRARTMAMQRSDELKEAASVMFQQVQSLGIPSWSCGYNIFEKNDEECTSFMSNHGQMQPQFRLPLKGHSTFIRFKTSKQNNEDFWVEELEGDELKAHYTYLFSLPGLDAITEENNKHGLTLPVHQFNHVVNFAQGNLLFITYEEIPEAYDIFKRFGKTFEQTYTRFLDLQKAEAQVREAQIEAALERVRSRTMAMHKSEDLHEVVKVVTEQLLGLGIRFNVSNFAKVYANGSWDLWVSSVEQAYPAFIHVPNLDHPIFNKVREMIAKGVDAFTDVYEQDEKNIFFHHFFENTIAKNTPEERKQFVYNSKGFARSLFATKNIWFSVSIYDTTPFSNEENTIFKRFANVFEQAYTRFLDLQKAEAQAREAQVEAALERVRARTLAMQGSGELAETAAVLFRQLILLGIQPNRLYIAIVKDNTGNTEFWITDEDGTKVSSAFETNLNDNPVFKKMFEGWKEQKKALIIDIQGEELQEYFRFLSSIHVPFKGGLEQKRRIQDIAYFSNGFIGIASPDEQPASTLQLLERFAYVFNLTFTRFNDLKLAEAHAIQAEQDLAAIKEAKQNAETALTELQATQKQLVQSEKMASLGELTAGIAHEIQNPLNFVNNFSEVSVELIQELKIKNEELKIEDKEVNELLSDISSNLEKINHHGKRADAIVKGMLQHSRTSNGQKEPTDINLLCDEYLRLSYHGLRAKDKSFNATLKTDFDVSIGKVNIVPQEIGRVIMNLLTNAFYAVNEKQKLITNNQQLTTPAYEPAVSISTKKLDGKIEVQVKDNGSGIPSAIKEKIFQPFFTTKPTGQGTGLGLSLSYDIVKAHGGALKLETKENEGTDFIIQLPLI